VKDEANKEHKLLLQQIDDLKKLFREVATFYAESSDQEMECNTEFFVKFQQFRIAFEKAKFDLEQERLKAKQDAKKQTKFGVSKKARPTQYSAKSQKGIMDDLLESLQEVDTYFNIRKQTTGARKPSMSATAMASLHTRQRRESRVVDPAVRKSMLRESMATHKSSRSTEIARKNSISTAKKQSISSERHTTQ